MDLFGRRFGWLIVLFGGLGAVFVGRADGHDIPNARIERAIQVTLAPGILRVEYEVALGELTLVQDLRQLDGEATGGDRAALFERYARVVGPLNARGLLVQVDGGDLELQPGEFSIVVEDHPRFRFQFRALVPTRGRLTLVDTNYTSSEGTARLALGASGGVTLIGDLPPTRVESIPLRASWQLSDAEERRGRRLDVTYAPGPVRVVRAPPLPVALMPPVPPDSRAIDSNLTRLLDLRARNTAAGWVVLAFVLGMIHAVQPGHGKTLVAAATLGETSAGPAWGLWLGLVTAACHLIGVVALALILWASASTRFGGIHLIVARGAGFLIAAAGTFRIGRHLAGVVSEHEHAIGPGAGVWSLGLAAGFVPCWDAVALVVLAAATGQLGRGFVLLGAFSAGLAVVLVGVGWAAARLRSRALELPSAPSLMRWVGLGSGVILAAVGLGLLRS